MFWTLSLRHSYYHTVRRMVKTLQYLHLRVLLSSIQRLCWQVQSREQLIWNTFTWQGEHWHVSLGHIISEKRLSQVPPYCDVVQLERAPHKHWVTFEKKKKSWLVTVGKEGPREYSFWRYEFLLYWKWLIASDCSLASCTCSPPHDDTDELFWIFWRRSSAPRSYVTISPRWC